ncbi:uncharacterized protein LOC144678259, partial [Cetorhinus maximus]
MEPDLTAKLQTPFKVKPQTGTNREKRHRRKEAFSVSETLIPDPKSGTDSSSPGAAQTLKKKKAKRAGGNDGAIQEQLQEIEEKVEIFTVEESSEEQEEEVATVTVVAKRNRGMKIKAQSQKLSEDETEDEQDLGDEEKETEDEENICQQIHSCEQLDSASGKTSPN